MGLSRLVEGVRRKVVFELPAKERLAEGLDGFGRGAANADRDDAMHGRDVEVVDMAVQHGKIAEPDEPLWLLLKFREIDAVDDAHGAVTTLGRPHRLDGRIVEHLL